MELPESPKKDYQAACANMHYKCNTGLYRLLPDDYGTLAEMTILDLRNNCVGRNGIKSLLEILSKCSKLQRVVLADNYLSNDSIPPLCHALKQCKHLSHLDLSGNPISQPSGKLLSRFVDEMPSLKCILLNNTLLNPGLARLVMNKVANRSGGSSIVEDVGKMTYKGLRILGEMKGGPRTAAAAQQGKKQSLAGKSPEDDWYAMETIWNVAAVAAPQPQEGWSGLASVMALVRQDETLATMYDGNQNEQ